MSLSVGDRLLPCPTHARWLSLFSLDHPLRRGLVFAKMAQNPIAHFLVWLLAAVIAWVASIWVSGESLDWSQQLSRAWLAVLPPPVYRRVGLPQDFNFTTPDTTAVILNWSRFPNVLQISSVLCSPALDGVIAQVFIWNNHPNPITYDVRKSLALLSSYWEHSMCRRFFFFTL